MENEKDVSVVTSEPNRFHRFLTLICFCLVTFFSFLSRLYGLAHPPEVLFDEVYFVNFPRYYLTREYFFDIHPPLAKLMLAVVANLANMDTSGGFKLWDPHNFNTKYRGGFYYYMRVWQASHGALLAPIGFLIVYKILDQTLWKNKVQVTTWHKSSQLFAATCAGLFIVTELSIQTISRAILTDSTLYMFMALGLFCFVQFFQREAERKKKSPKSFPGFWWWFWLINEGLMLGLAVSVKWTAIGLIGTLGCIHLWQFIHNAFKIVFPVTYANFRRKKTQATSHHEQANQNQVDGLSVKKLFSIFLSWQFVAGLTVLFLMISIYVIVWVIHFTVITRTGIDEDSMNENYRSQLIGSTIPMPKGEQPQGMLTNIWDLNKKMLEINQASVFPHAYASVWYQWPIMWKGVMYWQGIYKHKNMMAFVYMFGNPLLYWLVLFLFLLEVLYLITCLYSDRSLSFPEKQHCKWVSMMVFGYVVNILPYVQIHRTCFSYHYHPSLYFGLLLSALALRRLLYFPFLNRTQWRMWRWIQFLFGISITIVGLCGVLWSYYFFLPISFGIPIDPQQIQQRAWFSSWNLSSKPHLG